MANDTKMAVRVVNVRGLRTSEQRAGVCYVGRQFAGWPGHPLGNPFRPRYQPWLAKDSAGQRQAIESCLDHYVRWLTSSRVALEADLADLWEQCERGAKPLGCWCVNAEHGDGQPVVCHAQILAAELHRRFVEVAAS